MSSQTVITDPINETVTLDKEATIDRAKIIKNEERLRKYVDSLHQDVKRLNDSIQKITKEYKESLSKIQFLEQDSRSLQKEITDLTKKQLEWYESSQKPKGSLLLLTSIATDLRGAYFGFIGLGYTKNGYLFSAGIDPLISEPIDKSLTYSIGIGIPIFK